MPDIKQFILKHKLLSGSALGVVLLAGFVIIGSSHKEEQLAACNTGNDIDACEYVLSLSGESFKKRVKPDILKAHNEELARQDRIEKNLKAAEIRVAKEVALKAATAKIKEEATRADLAKRRAEYAKEAAAAGKWNYDTYNDEATGKTAKRAVLISENTMNFSSPYQGTQFGRFTVRNHPRYGIDAFLSIDNGQLLCDNYNNPNILIRFDKGAASTYRCNGPSDHSSDVVFIEGVGRLEDRMRSAKKMYVTISVYREGSRTWEFDVKGYNKDKI